MPVRAKKPCKKPRCPNLVDGGYCAEHKKGDEQKRKGQDRARGTAAERGYDARWREARAAYLRANPLCTECEREGRLTAATVVDHIVPHKGGKGLFWDSRNWQGLCARHHNVKTAKEDGGWGKSNIRMEGATKC